MFRTPKWWPPLDPDGDVHPVPHGLYVALAGGQATSPALAGQTLRLADWYVRMKEGRPQTLVNETYSLVRFDGSGRVDRSAAAAPEAASDAADAPANAGWPTRAERERMRALLFGADAPAALHLPI